MEAITAWQLQLLNELTLISDRNENHHHNECADKNINALALKQLVVVTMTEKVQKQYPYKTHNHDNELHSIINVVKQVSAQTN